MKPVHKILQTEFCEEFVELMKNRMVMGCMKYGLVSKYKREDLDNRDEIKNCRFRIRAYLDSGNPEYLVDAANFLMIEFMQMKGQFIPTDDDEYSRIV